MLKKIGLPVIALLGLLSFAPYQAKAAVRVGVYAGAPAVVYTAPVCARPVVIPARPVVVYGHPWIRHEIRRDLRFRR